MNYIRESIKVLKKGLKAMNSVRESDEKISILEATLNTIRSIILHEDED